MTTEQNVSMPATKPSRVPLICLIVLIALTVIYAFVAPVIAPGADDSQQGTIGLAVSLMIVMAGSFAGFALIGAAMGAARKGASGAIKGSVLTLIAWIVLTAVVTYLLTN